MEKVTFQISTQVFECKLNITKLFFVCIVPPDENTIFKYNVVEDINIPEDENIVLTTFEKDFNSIVTFEGEEFNVDEDEELETLIDKIKKNLFS